MRLSTPLPNSRLSTRASRRGALLAELGGPHMTSRCAVTSMNDNWSEEDSTRLGRRERRRAARRQKTQTCCRVAGLVAVLLVGVSATAAGVSADPGHTPKAYAATDTDAPATKDLPNLDLT